MNAFRALFSGIAATALMASAAPASHAAELPIYRCAQADGSALYTDIPCAGGGLVDIHPGKPDPAAAERLARAQAALDAGAAQRRAEQAREAAQREQAAQMRDAAAAAGGPPAPDGGYDSGYGYGSGYLPVYGGRGKPRPPHSRPPAPPPKRVVPAKINGMPEFNVPGSMSGGRTPR